MQLGEGLKFKVCAEMVFKRGQILSFGKKSSSVILTKKTTHIDLSVFYYPVKIDVSICRDFSAMCKF